VVDSNRPSISRPTPVPRPTYTYTSSYDSNKSDKNTIVALLLCCFLGGFGIHNFYLGKIKKGIIYLVLNFVLSGLIWIVCIYDAFKIAYGKSTDSKGYNLVASAGGKVFLWIYIIAIGLIFLIAISSIF